MISEVLLKIISGSVVGYTTNDLALRMLFEKVMGIPSIVEQTKEEFIKNISQLVESEIIRHDNISEEVKKEAFQNALHIMLTEFIETHLKEAFREDELIDEIPEIGTSIDRFLALIDEQSKETIRKGLNGLLMNSNIADFTSKQHIRYICDQSFDIILSILKEESLIEVLTNDIWHEFKRERVKSVVSPILFEALDQYTGDFFDELHELIKNDELPLNNFIDNFLKQIENDELILKLSQSISQKSISELLGSGDHIHIAKEVHRILDKELQDQSDNAPIKRLINILIDVVSQEETTIFDLLPPTIADNFEQFLRKNMPIILDAVVEWIQENRDEINHLVNEAFEEEASLIGRWLMGLFVDSVSERFKVVDEIIHIANDQKTEQNSKALAEQGAEFILDYLKKNSIGSLIHKFDQKGLIDTIHALLKTLVDEKLLGQGAESMSSIMDRKIESIWSSDRQHEDLSKLFNFLIDEQLISKFIYQKKSTEKAKSIVSERLDRIKDQPLYTLFTDATISKFGTKTQDFSEKILHSEKVAISKTLEGILDKEITQKPFSALIGANTVEKWTPKLKKLSVSFIRDEFEKGKKRPIHDLVKIAQNSTSLPKKLTSGIIGYIDRNINRLMKGQVSRIVADNLQNKHNKLPEMVKGFMGQNMKPITYFGAFLGAIAGGLTFFVPMGENPLSLGLSIALVYGVTGLATNWIAIKMIFRPYQAKYIMGIKVPFTPSVVSANKQNFANNMGKFVGQQLLNEESIGNDIQGKLSTLKKNIYNTFVETDYHTLDILLETEKKGIAKKVSKDFTHNLFSKRYEYAQTFANKIEEELVKINSFPSSSLQTRFIDLAHRDTVYETLSKFMTNKVIDLFNNDLMLNDAIPDKFVDQMFDAVKQILRKQLDKAHQWILKDDLFDELKKVFRDKLMEYRSKSLNEIPIFANNKVKIKESTWRVMAETIEKEDFQNRVLHFFEKQLLDISNQEQPIRTLFGGKPYEALQANSIKIVEQLIQRVIHHLSENNEKIAEDVYASVVKKRRIATLYEGNIKRTSLALTDRKIPDLLLRGLPSITKKIQDRISIISKQTKIKDLNVAINNEPLKETVIGLLQNQRLLTSVQFVLNRIVDEVFETKIEKILSVGSISEGELYDQLSQNLAPEIEIVRSHLSEQISNEEKKEKIVTELSDIIKEISKKVILSKKVKDIFRNTDEEELRDGIQSTFTILLNSRSSQKFVSSIAHHIATYLEENGFAELVNHEQLIYDVEKGIAKSLENNKNQEVIRELIKNLSVIFLNDFNKCLTTETKNYLLSKILDGLMESASPHTGALIRTIDFQGIVVNEINQMDPAKIEELFYGFAGMYFRRLIIYGFFLGLPIGAMLDFGLIQLVSFVFKE
ncbi:DUF445 family protein [Flammeovirga aprica]|uniref:DUF445 family protein n=1 Tax=Flammeovirga aprica JL-4 TaxID=694437 RepID=A0A7X9RX89_9BACT|nr:DUF445 family protein [Flammeovirga aprica]NME70458.1 DUF445 family protein [Flammeovirga aprica JL-4]